MTTEREICGIESEQIVLAGVFTEEYEALVGSVRFIKANDFGDPRHQAIWRAISDLQEQRAPLDFITVTSHLRREKTLVAAGGAAYISEVLPDVLVYPALLEHHAALVLEASMARQAHRLTGRATAALADPGADPQKVISDLQGGLMKLSARAASKDLVSMEDATNTAFALYEERLHAGTDRAVIPTGFAQLDRVLGGGMRTQDAIVIAGRPGMGKTTLALNIASHVAIREKLPVLFANMEMKEHQLASRVICAETSTNNKNWRLGKTQMFEQADLGSKRAEIAAAPIDWMCTAIKDVKQIEAQARRVQMRRGALGLIVVDFIQRMARSKDNRTAELTTISNDLKNLGVDLEVPVIVVSQLNRKVDERTPPRPVLSDLKATGALEEDADVALFPYRAGYYDETIPPEDLCEIIIAKQREGPKGSVWVHYREEYNRFETPKGAN